MSNETKVIFAGLLGATVALGVWLSAKKGWKKSASFCYYDDFHKQFQKLSSEETQHGVEYLHVR